MNSIYPQILEQLRSGYGIVLATVVRTSGSTPQKPGSSALFGEDGLIAGTVGGGILEDEVQHIADSVLISAVSNHYYFNLDADEDEEGSICGGEAVILIDANPGKHLKALEKMELSLSHRQGGYLLTIVSRESDSGRAIHRYWIKGAAPYSLPSEFDPNIRDLITDQLSELSGSGFAELQLPSSLQASYEMVLFEALKPLPRLVIAGGGHIGKALAHLGLLLDFEITVIDDRQEFANPENIPDGDYFVVEDIGKAMSELIVDPDTYIVLVTRGHNHDAEALKHCIGSDAAYIGMIGSSHKVGIIKKRFLTEGLATPEQWSKIHAPIGLLIGSKTVQEIAVSIAAQLVSIRNLNKKKYAR